MACYASQIIATAKAELGYYEKRTNSSLNDKTANKGSGNWTKYAYEIDTNYPTFYNGKKNGYAWCDCFVDWLFLHTFGLENALRLTCQPLKSLGAACPYSYSYYKAKGRTGNSPKLGAQIFFGSTQSNLYHTGIVIGFDSTYVYTIEGNTSDMVAQRTYKRVGSAVYGYGYPDYDAEGSGSTGSTTTPPPADIPNVGTLDKVVDFYGWLTADTAARTWPGNNYAALKSIGAIAKNTKIGVCSTVKGSDGSEWYYVVVNSSVYGFLPASVITKTDPTAAAKPTDPTAGVPATPNGTTSKLVAWDGVMTETYSPRTWAGATTKLTKTGDLVKGEVVGVCGLQPAPGNANDKWYYVKISKNGGTYYGFVPVSVVTPKTESTQTVTPPSNTDIHTVLYNATINTTCSVRVGPGSKNGKISGSPMVSKGEVVGVCFGSKDKDGDMWYLCKVKNRYFGYISVDYLNGIQSGTRVLNADGTPATASAAPAATTTTQTDDSGKYTTT